MTIDLRSIDAIDTNSGRNVTSVGARSIWKDVYAKLVPLNLTLTGARVAGLGVGGFTTGGRLILVFQGTAA